MSQGTKPDIGLCNGSHFNRRLNTSRNVQALKSITRGLSFWDNEPRWLNLAANLQLELGDTDAALSHLEQAKTIEPENASHHFLLGKAYMRAGSPGNAVRAMEEANRLEPDHPEFWLDQASAYQAIGDLKEAAESAEQAIKLAPRKIAPLLARTKIAVEAGDHQKAFNFAQAALRLNADDPKALTLMSRIISSMERTSEAISVLNDAISKAGDPLPLLLEKANLLEISEGNQASLEFLKKLSKRFPEQPAVLAALSKSYMYADDVEKAIQIAQQAVRMNTEELDPSELAHTHFNLGKLLRQTGQLDQAIHHLGKAIQEAPEFLEPYIEIGLVHQDRRQHSEALEYFQQAISVAPNDPRAYWQAGQMLKGCKDYAAAESMLRRAAALVPKDLNIQRQLGAVIALKLVHQPDEAIVDA